METCPKCRFALEPGATECPACGVILNKLRPAPPPRLRPARGAVPGAPDPHALSAPSPSPSALPPDEVITLRTIEALAATRPWLRFVVGYGFLMSLFFGVVGAAIFVSKAIPRQAQPLSLVYFASMAVLLAILFPLSRSAIAVGNFQPDDPRGASESLEDYAAAQAKFWQRMGALCVVSLLLMVIGAFMLSQADVL
jgi:hypothetical protein